MSARRTGRTCSTAVAACALAVGAMTACGDDSDDVGGTASAAPTESSASARVEPLSEVMADVREAKDQRAHEVAGGVILVEQGEDRETLAYGDARLRPRRPMRDDARFPVASVTKVMVATVIMQLVQEGRVRLDDTVEELLPGMLPFGAKVTVEDLLDHRSGIFDVINDDKGTYTVSTDPTDATLQQVLDQPPVDEPGTVTRYTNPGFWLLGKIVERATSRPLAAELEERVFEPARMTSSTLATDLDEERRLAHGYDAAGQDVTPGDFTGPWAAGGVVSTVGDVAAFYDALFDGDLVPADVVTDMTTSRGLFDGSPNAGYGLGITVLDAECGQVLGHFGDLPGFHTVAFRNPAKDRTVVEFVNTDGEQAATVSEIVAFEAICH